MERRPPLLMKPQGKRVIAFLMQVLEAEDSKTVQALICQGLAKLMLFGLVTDERVRIVHFTYLNRSLI